ncbi:TerC family protein [Variovorax sp. RA8]|uniref:TerC family protein n=1 Tax=Variovorax sp. (strain JCM 16519 / RA8) TaxID=662548 RepID=UPI000B2F0F23|nr:TerC family protein [Variovorax sp. RA8]VTU37983.1 integral membrane protein, YjbE family [Variovorax sp. RA8]
MEYLQTAGFWIGLVKIVWINIILSGDNAVVIAMAARSLPPAQQKKAVVFGSGAAVVLRIALTVVAARLLKLPFLQILGGALLLWIGVQLLGDEGEDGGEEKQYGSMFAAVRTILLADLVMSLDNVIAVAAAAQGNMLLLILGLAISIPLVIFGSTLMIKLMERFPIIIMLGAALIGWVGGETIASDAALSGVLSANPWLHYAGAAAGAFFVVAYGKWQQRRAVTAVQ